MENFYDILGVPEDADLDAIKKSFRILAKQHHPDIAKGSDEQFRKISHAYKVLSNPESRYDYDRTLRSFKAKSGRLDEYAGNNYTVEGKHLRNILRELANQSHFTNITVKFKGKKLFSLAYPTAAALGVVGIVKAPLAFILLNLGIGAFFTVEVTNKVMTLFNEAIDCHNAGNIARAEELYKTVLRKSEYFIPARINLGLLYRQRGEHKKAVHCFRQVLDTVPFGEIGDIARKNLEELRGF